MKNLITVLILISLFFSCDRNNQETPEPADFGYLSMNISVSITEETASGRVEAVPTDDWKVTIFDASDDSEVMVFDPFASAPAEVQLPTGEYYIEAHSNNFQEAAFSNPYYFGRSANFTIDKEELKTIDIDAELANSKVAINYSANVTSTFDDYTGAVTVVSSGATLPYAQGETREGYFVAEPLDVVVDLSYTKLDGSFISRQFTANINAQPKTLYNINVDASLEDGKIVININVDERFETVDLTLGNNISGTTFLNIIDTEIQSATRWVVETTENQYIKGGALFTNGVPRAFASKFDMEGVEIWRYESTLSSSSIDAIATNDGGVLLGSQDRASWIILEKLNASGLLERSFNIAAPGLRNMQDFSPASNGDVLFCGVTTQSDDAYLARADGAGNLLWSTILSGSAQDYAFAISGSEDGGFIVAARSYSSDGDFPTNGGDADLWIFKYSSDNNLQWSTSIGTPNEEWPLDIIQTNDGGFVVSGVTQDATFNSDAIVIKVDASGGILWSETYGSQFTESGGYSVIENNVGDLVFAGIQNTGIEAPRETWLVKVSQTDGDFINEYTYPGDKVAFDLLQAKDLGYVMAGAVNGDIFIFKVGENGEFTP